MAAAAGDTALHDAVALGVEQMKNAQNSRRALIVISDGVDNINRLSRGELLRVATEADVEVHTLVLAEVRAGKRSPVDIAERQDGIAFLGELSKATGGLSFLIRDEAGMAAAAEKIGRALHTQYVIGYRRGGRICRNSGCAQRYLVLISYLFWSSNICWASVQNHFAV